MNNDDSKQDNVGEWRETGELCRGENKLLGMMHLGVILIILVGLRAKPCWSWFDSFNRDGPTNDAIIQPNEEDGKYAIN